MQYFIKAGIDIMDENYIVPESYDPAVDVWTALSETKKPIIMYGMGDGADKILSVMEKYGIEPADFMASDCITLEIYFQSFWCFLKKSVFYSS